MASSKNVHTSNLQMSRSRLCIQGVCACVCNNNLKRGHGFEREQGDSIREGLVGGKGREKQCNHITILKNKRSFKIMFIKKYQTRISCASTYFNIPISKLKRSVLHSFILYKQAQRYTCSLTHAETPEFSQAPKTQPQSLWHTLGSVDGFQYVLRENKRFNQRDQKEKNLLQSSQ